MKLKKDTTGNCIMKRASVFVLCIGIIFIIFGLVAYSMEDRLYAEERMLAFVKLNLSGLHEARISCALSICGKQMVSCTAKGRVHDREREEENMPFSIRGVDVWKDVTVEVKCPNGPLVRNSQGKNECEHIPRTPSPKDRKGYV
jgi:hypothetical protein